MTAKRKFQNTQTCLSKGFESLAVPSNRETLMVEYKQLLELEKSNIKKAEVKNKRLWGLNNYTTH